jgi:hypothetical protein
VALVTDVGPSAPGIKGPLSALSDVLKLACKPSAHYFILLRYKDGANLNLESKLLPPTIFDLVQQRGQREHSSVIQGKLDRPPRVFDLDDLKGSTSTQRWIEYLNTKETEAWKIDHNNCWFTMLGYEYWKKTNSDRFLGKIKEKQTVV